MVDVEKKLIYQFMQYKRSSLDDTKTFEKLPHNNKLCPKVQQQLEHIFSAFQKYRTITYDIQGFKDEGTDIVIRLSEEEKAYYICFQIKSENDLKNKTYLNDIKGQYADTINHYNNDLLDYYILLCCNGKSNKNKVRMIEASLGKLANVHVIESEFVLTFLKLGLLQIDAFIKSKIGSQDIIMRKALDVSSDLTPTKKAILYYFIWMHIYKNTSDVSIDEIISNEFIVKIYEIVPDFCDEYFFEDELPDIDELTEYEKNELQRKPEFDGIEFSGCNYYDNYYLDLMRERGLSILERISFDLDALVDSYIYLEDSGRYKLFFKDVYPLIILMMDASVRYEYEDSELLFYMMDLFGPIKGYSNEKSFS